MICFCGSPATLQPNSVIYSGRSFGNGFAYVCTRFPACRGSVGVHPDRKPLGTIPDAETKKLRIEVHAIVDPLWRAATNGRPKKRNRGSVYGWLRRVMNMTPDECHIGKFTKADCLRALEAIKANPYKQHEKKGESFHA